MQVYYSIVVILWECAIHIFLLSDAAEHTNYMVLETKEDESLLR